MTRMLSEVPIGEETEIVEIGGCGALRRRLLDMGVTRRTSVRVERRAPLGDPIEIAVRGYRLALREAEARLIQVRDD